MTIDEQRGKEAANLLVKAFKTSGIHGKTDMPEDIIPKNMEIGSLEHIIFITQTVSIDYQRDADALWASSRQTWEDPYTQYLFTLKSLSETSVNKIQQDMQLHKLSRKPLKDANIWRTVGVSFYKKWASDPRKFLESCGRNAPITLGRLKSETHQYNTREIPDFPYLRGDKIGPLWLRMLRDNVKLSNIQALEQVPIPVDIHVARASLSLGIVRGQFKGKLTNLFEIIRDAWFKSVSGLETNGRPMVALDVDAPLWHLSKYGCTKRDKMSGYCPLFQRCEAKDFCVPGVINITKDKVELNT